MSLFQRPLLLVPLSVLIACGGHPPLRQITPVEGSRTREGGEIRRIDSTHGNEIRPLRPGTRTIERVDTGRTIRPLDGGAAGREVTPTREITPLSNDVVPVDGTTWVGSNHEGPITFEFLIGGILRYTTPNGTWSNGTWSQQGNTITFEMNSHYADYTGQIRGTRMSGTGHNTPGARWDWRAERQP